MSASDLKYVRWYHVDQWLQGARRLGALGLVELVGDPIVHGDLLLRDLFNLACKCRVVAQVDVVKYLNAVRIAPQLIPYAVGFKQVIRDTRSRLQEVDQHQTNNHRRHGREEIGHDRLDAKPAQFGGVTQARYT